MNLIHTNPLPFIPGGYSILSVPQCRASFDSMAHIMRHFISGSKLNYTDVLLAKSSNLIGIKNSGDKLTVLVLSFFYALKKLWRVIIDSPRRPFHCSVCQSILTRHPHLALSVDGYSFNTVETANMQNPTQNAPIIRATIKIISHQHCDEEYSLSDDLNEILKKAAQILASLPPRCACVIFDADSHTPIATTIYTADKKRHWLFSSGNVEVLA